MNYSNQGRGKISMLKLLLRRLIQGDFVGPATAIGGSYKVLELKRVIELKADEGSRFYMQFLKKK